MFAVSGAMPIVTAPMALFSEGGTSNTITFWATVDAVFPHNAIHDTLSNDVRACQGRFRTSSVSFASHLGS